MYELNPRNSAKIPILLTPCLNYSSTHIVKISTTNLYLSQTFVNFLIVKLCRNISRDSSKVLEKLKTYKQCFATAQYALASVTSTRALSIPYS